MPLLAGEFLNVFVSLILVVTLFVIFTDTQQPADLILNAVAVNFLGAVDGEFVSNDLKTDALANFRRLFEIHGNDLMDAQDHTHSHNFVINAIMRTFLTTIVVAGIIFAALFAFVPESDSPRCPPGQLNCTKGEFGHRGARVLYASAVLV
jgi:hypothetical protein